MSYYVDMDSTAEDIQEDEELIEAVEALVENAAVSVWSGIVNDLQQLASHAKNLLETLFPVLIDYQNDQSLIRQDMEKLALAIVLFLLALMVLSPLQKNRTRIRGDNNKRAGWFRRNRTNSLKSFNLSPHSEDESDNTSEIPAYEEETDEERFEKMWTSILSCRYRRLVLPPSCRLVEKPKASALKREAAVPIQKETRKDKKKEEDDDNPALRLQTYWRHFLHFIQSLFTFDYAGAGWTLILWMQGIRRYRRTNSNRNLEEEDDDNDAASQTSDNDQTAKKEIVPTSPTFATPKTDPEVEAVLANQNSPRNIISALSPLQEEKKEGYYSEESSSPRLPPMLPPSPDYERQMSGNSAYYEAALHDGHSSSEGDIKLSPRKPLLQKRPSKKQKNALELYRASHNIAPGMPSLSPDVPAPLPDTAAPVPISSESRKEKMLKQYPDADHWGSQKYFFETANSKDSLKKLSVEVSVPDKNGYILGDEFLPDSSYTPLLVFVNSRSGPQQGHMLLTQLRLLLNPIQVWDLANGGPEAVLESFCILTRLRILVCGGDGTVSWIISALERLQLSRKWPAIAILPLGTGNDLARIHGWGGGYNNESLIGILEQISESYMSLLDRWDVTIEEGKSKKKEVKSFTNYLGVGADAQAALQVHYLRESRPEWFFSRLVNKAWYGIFGAEDLIKASSVHVRKEISLVADGVEIPLPSDSQGIIVLNIDSYAGGVPLWSLGTKLENSSGMGLPTLDLRRTRSMSEFRSKSNRSTSFERIDSMDDLQTLLSDEDRFTHVTACDRPSSCQDGVLEIVSIRGAFHLGQIKVGLSSAQRLCQCREVTIKIKKKVAVQIDGEPWRQSQCTLRVKRKKDPAIMLHRSADDGGVETEMSKLLDWAEERNLIDSQVHTILMKEFSRRIESKTRQRRVRSQDTTNILHNLKRAIGSTGAIANMPGAQQWQGNIAF